MWLNIFSAWIDYNKFKICSSGEATIKSDLTCQITQLSGNDGVI